MQKFRITALTLTLLVTVLVASLFSGIVTMLAELQELSLMAPPADGVLAVQVGAQPKVQPGDQATANGLKTAVSR